MPKFYRRTTPGLRENLLAGLTAAGLATGVAATSFYLVRLLLCREPLEELPRDGGGRGTGSESPNGAGNGT